MKSIRAVRAGKEYQRDRLSSRKVEGLQAVIFIMGWKAWVMAESKESRKEREIRQRRVIERLPRGRHYAEILPSYLIQ